MQLTSTSDKPGTQTQPPDFCPVPGKKVVTGLLSDQRSRKCAIWNLEKYSRLTLDTVLE